MRMPIFSYFLVVGSVLTGLLVWFGDDRELASAPLKTSQAIGVPTPFKGKPDARPEAMPDLTNVNFAAAPGSNCRPAAGSRIPANQLDNHPLGEGGSPLVRLAPLAPLAPLARVAGRRVLRARREPVGHAGMARAV